MDKQFIKHILPICGRMSDEILLYMYLLNKNIFNIQ